MTIALQLGSMVLAILLASMEAIAADGLVTQFDPSGLISLRYAGIELLLEGKPVVSSVSLESVAGGTRVFQSASLEDLRRTVDLARREVGLHYAWGVATFAYRIVENNFHLTVTIHNKTDKTIAGFSLRPLQLKFPARPTGWEKPAWRVQRSLDNVVAVPAVFGESQVVACLDSVDPPVALGFGKPLDQAGLEYKLEFYGDVPAADAKLPIVHRTGLARIEAGQSRSFELSLRFAPAAMSLRELTADLAAGFRKAHPAKCEWPDRRPIGMLMLQCDGRSATNPRGWFKKPDLNISAADGNAEFRKLVMAYADRAVASMKACDAQGGIVWNIEGEENPHPITYIGDPRMLPVLAPEMDEVADVFFKKFKDAGLRTGVTIRPSQIYIHETKKKWDHGTGSHGPQRNPLNENYDDIWPKTGGKAMPWFEVFPVAERLCRKIEYAKKRWGCTIFYIDTNGFYCQMGEKGEFKWMLLTGDMLRYIKDRHPDVLLIPELSKDNLTNHLTNWAYGAQYQELDLKGYGTPAEVREVYPEAFSVVNIADGPIEEKRGLLVNAVKNGDILLTRGWFDDKRNAVVKGIYAEAGPFKPGRTGGQ
jgi:hypothetical protein